MYAQHLPDSKEALAELAPVIAALHSLFRRAYTEVVEPFFAGLVERPLDESVATHLLRYEVLTNLRIYGIDVFEDPESDATLGLKQLPQNGIEGTHGAYRFKVRRSRDGSVPPAGDSERLQRFYNQGQMVLPGFDEGEDAATRHFNVLFLWNFDAAYGEFKLNLAMPISCGGAYGKVMVHFNVPVPNPRREEEARAKSDTLVTPEELAITLQDIEVSAVDEEGVRRTQLWKS